jgi:polyphosphate glucokinase
MVFSRVDPPHARPTGRDRHVQVDEIAGYGYVIVLVIDAGGTGVKFRVSTGAEIRRFRSGPALTPETFVAEVHDRTTDWAYDVVSIGYPGAVAGGAAVGEPGNLAAGWVGYDFAAAFQRPGRLANDAILQALGAYRGGRMLFLGLGTGVGSAVVSEHVLMPLELGCLPHPDGGTLFDHLGRAGRKRRGHAAWQADVLTLAPQLRSAMAADYVVVGGGNGRKLESLPPEMYYGDRHDAFEGGIRLWEEFVEPHDAAPSGAWRILR